MQSDKVREASDVDAISRITESAFRDTLQSRDEPFIINGLRQVQRFDRFAVAEWDGEVVGNRVSPWRFRTARIIGIHRAGLASQSYRDGIAPPLSRLGRGNPKHGTAAAC